MDSPFTLDPSWDFLNHGSFGACPRVVQEAQSTLRARMEAQPVRFLDRQYEGLLDEARQALAAFLHADPEGLAFVPNATTGVNAVVRSFPLRAGETVLVTDHAYNACRNALDDAARRVGARVTVAPIPFPLRRSEEVLEALLGAVVPGTRLALVDHVTSPTALVLPIREIVQELGRRGIDTLVDGAHAPGMVPLDLDGLGAAFYVGNCHKWMCAPKGSGFLWVRRDHRETVRPVVVSHGANSRRTDRSPFRLEFDWVGTLDPTPWLSVPTAIACVGALDPNGWGGLMETNRTLALRARDLLCTALEVPPPCPDSMIGAMAAIPLPRRTEGRAPAEEVQRQDPLQRALAERTRIEVPIIPWPAPPHRLIRVSAQVYNRQEQYARLAERLVQFLGEGL